MNKVCFFKKYKIKIVDYRDEDILRKFLNPQGKIMSRKKTGCSAKGQKQLEKAVKRARYMALIPYTED